MGCDIHVFPEVFDGEKWVSAEPFELADWWYDAILDEEAVDYGTPEFDVVHKRYEEMPLKEALELHGSDSRTYWSNPFNVEYGRRNYSFFSILADVRNDGGFISGQKGNSFRPICSEKGIPDDISNEVKSKADPEGLDYHSHSWHTLKDLLEYDWSQVTYHRANLDSWSFVRFLKDGTDMIWLSARVDNASIHITNSQMANMYLGIYGALDPDLKNRYYTSIDWEETYLHSVGEDYFENFLNKLRSYGDPENVRIVFWFDN